MLSPRQMQSQNLSKRIEGLSEKDAQKILGNGKTVWIPVAVTTGDGGQIAMFEIHEGNELILDTLATTGLECHQQ